DGTIVAWGDNEEGQSVVPSPNVDFAAVAAGWSHSLGLRDSSGTGVEGPALDDVVGAATLVILSLAPNPFNPSTEVCFETRGSGQVTMEIYDVSGRRVGTVPLGLVEPGLHHVRWDGRDARGHNVSSGVYFVRLHDAEGESRAVKAVLVR
ncbi:MAG: T9SS type A sorting domain-containing protein, partial [Candidatus Eisenbacteria sp.]|nr:T9SS type A sorting domain-containing protein [Candidatus Eisenbacteria bacterium]